MDNIGSELEAMYGEEAVIGKEGRDRTEGSWELRGKEEEESVDEDGAKRRE